MQNVGLFVATGALVWGALDAGRWMFSQREPEAEGRTAASMVKVIPEPEERLNPPEAAADEEAGRTANVSEEAPLDAERKTASPTAGSVTTRATSIAAPADDATDEAPERLKREATSSDRQRTLSGPDTEPKVSFRSRVGLTSGGLNERALRLLERSVSRCARLMRPEPVEVALVVLREGKQTLKARRGSGEEATSVESCLLADLDQISLELSGEVAMITVDVRW
ncbi:MAG: hypothetical protein HC923_07550 [Myxococcales bacterium]|nr:hypothetical protein [Myxococcales bacterium]